LLVFEGTYVRTLLHRWRDTTVRWEYVTKTYPRYFAHWAQVTNPLMIKTARAV